MSLVISNSMNSYKKVENGNNKPGKTYLLQNNLILFSLHVCKQSSATQAVSSESYNDLKWEGVGMVG